MKTILTSLLFIACFVSAFTQETASLNDNLYSMYELEITADHSSSKAMNRLSQKMITNQIRTYLSEHLVYPEVLRDYRIKGEVVMEVTYTKKGKILNLKITDSSNSIFEKVVKESISKFDCLHLNNSDYFGAEIIIIPIYFSM